MVNITKGRLEVNLGIEHETIAVTEVFIRILCQY